MDVNQTQLMEIGLNVVGFLAAGGILMVLGSLFRRKDKKQNHPAQVIATTSRPETIVPVIAADVRDAQFIDLSGGRSKPASTTTQSGSSLARRNRAEVYELAQRMLKERKSASDISTELGVSQAEVNLLRARTVQDKGVKHV